MRLRRRLVRAVLAVMASGATFPLAGVIGTGQAVAAPAITSGSIAYVAAAQPALNASPGTLHVADANGANDRSITTDDPVTQPMWSPDGTSIAYTAVTTSGPPAQLIPVSRVWIVGPDGSNDRPETPDGYTLAGWSPDGTRLLVNGPDGIDVVDLADADRINVVVPPTTPNVVARSAVWSPDGSQLAYFTSPAPSETCGGPSILHIVNSDGSADHALSVRVSNEVGCLDTRNALAWSPDGQWLVFDAEVGSGLDTREAVQAVHPDGTALRALYNPGPGAGAASIMGFSPDGSAVAFLSGSGSGSGAGAASALRTSAMAGGASRIVFAPPSGQAVTAAAWTPDASALVFNLVTASGTADLIAVAADGTDPHPLTSSGDVARDFSIAPSTQRLAGVTRIETAISISRASYSSAPAVVVARDDLYPDALAAAPLAAKVGGPLLLSDPRSASAVLLAEVRRLGAATAYLVGDESALSADVATQLRDVGIASIVRLGGATRYDTAALIAERVGGTSAYLVRGDNWPDAASAATLAAYQQRPILLTQQSVLPAAVVSALDQLAVSSATIVGGPAAVSAAVETTVNNGGVSTTRLQGADRYGTSAAVATAEQAAGLTGTSWLADGANWPDAITAGPSAAVQRGPLLLVDPSSLANSPATAVWLSAHRPTRVIAVGGPDAVSPADTTAAIG